MRKAFLLFAALLTFAPNHAFALNAPECKDEQHCDRDPEHLVFFVRSFFTWYVVTTYENLADWDQPTVHKILSKNLTPHFLKQKEPHTSSGDAPESWARNLLCAQDMIDEWFYPEVTINDISKDYALFTVTFLATKDQAARKIGWTEHTLNVKLVPYKGRWRIDWVDGKSCAPSP